MISQIYWIEPFKNFRLGTMARPRGGDWLEDEIKGWKRAGVEAVVSALTDQEMIEFNITEEENLCKRHGIQFYRLSIQDRSVPLSMNEWKSSIDDLLKSFNGKSLVTHCRMGIGRASMIAISVMLNHRVSFQDAFHWMEQARGTSIPDTEEQLNWLLDLSKLLEN